MLIYSVPQSHVVIIERLGKFSSVQTQGLHFKIPFIEEVRYVTSWGDDTNKNGYQIELAEQKSDTPIRECHTKDNVAVKINASIYWRMNDPEKADYEIDILPTSITDISLNALRSNVGKLSLDQVLSERQELNNKIFIELKETASKWGVLLTRVEIQELSTSDETADAMRQEMTAERLKRSIILEAEGTQKSQVTIAKGKAEAIKILADADVYEIDKIAEAESKYLDKLKERVSDGQATQILIAQKFIKGMDSISQNPSDKVFLPNNFQGIFSLPIENGGNIEKT